MKSHSVRISRVAISDDDDEEVSKFLALLVLQRMDDQCICANVSTGFGAEFVRSHHLKQVASASSMFVSACGHRRAERNQPSTRQHRSHADRTRYADAAACHL